MLFAAALQAVGGNIERCIFNFKPIIHRKSERFDKRFIKGEKFDGSKLDRFNESTNFAVYGTFLISILTKMTLLLR